MSLPLAPLARIGAYTLKNHIKGGKYPLVLMLEPLLRCNLACPGCGKTMFWRNGALTGVCNWCGNPWGMPAQAR